jgi:CRISPR-associated endoribonuclease Cas6
MRLNIEIQGHLHLPAQYNHLVQGLIYSHLEPNLSSWLHDTAHQYGERKFKMFTFGRLQGVNTWHREARVFEFPRGANLKLASTDARVLSSFAETLLSADHVRLGNNIAQVATVGIVPPPRLAEHQTVIVRTLSPITTYSTLHDARGAKKTYYYAPTEPDWESMILANLQRKALALGWDERQVMALQGRIAPLSVKTLREVITSFKNTVIKAWNGTFMLDLPGAWLELALDSGLGSKNAQGFGMVELRSVN